MAIGATRRDVLAMVTRQGLVLSTIGIVLGLTLSVPIFRLLASALAGLGSLSLWMLALVPLGVLLVTLAASVIPAHRASRISPTEAYACRAPEVREGELMPQSRAVVSLPLRHDFLNDGDGTVRHVGTDHPENVIFVAHS